MNQIKYESVSGQTLQKRFNTLAKYYRQSTMPVQWIAEEFKKSLLSTIERGTIIVTAGDERGLS